MSRGAEQIRARMADYLTAQGLAAVTAWSGQERLRRDGPVAVVSLRGCQVGAAGFQDYLGERYDPETGLWEELYGRRAELTVGLDLYAPADGSGDDLQDAWDRLAEALTRGGPDGLAVREFSCGETAYDTSARLLKRPAQAVCEGYLYAAAQPGEDFVEFELRGGLKT